MNDRARAGSILAIHKTNFAAMGSGYLLRECEADAAACGLRCVERHEEIFGIGDSHPAVLYGDNQS